MSEVHTCPNCRGTGLVSYPPYLAGDIGQWTGVGAGPYPCKSCNGKGVIVVKDDVLFYALPARR